MLGKKQSVKLSPGCRIVYIKVGGVTHKGTAPVLGDFSAESSILAPEIEARVARQFLRKYCDTLGSLSPTLTHQSPDTEVSRFLGNYR